jgi:hypothetical protein
MERRLTEEAEIDVDSKKVRRLEGGADKLGGEMRGGGVRRVDGKGAERKRERGQQPSFLNRMRERERAWRCGDRRMRGGGSAWARHTEEGERRRGGLAQRWAVWGGQQQPPAVRHERCHATQTEEPGG